MCVNNRLVHTIQKQLTFRSLFTPTCFNASQFHPPEKPMGVSACVAKIVFYGQLTNFVACFKDFFAFFEISTPLRMKL